LDRLMAHPPSKASFLLYTPHIERLQITLKEKPLYLKRYFSGSKPVRRGQALSSSVVSRARRRESNRLVGSVLHGYSQSKSTG
jgi:hypothetical protein